MGVHGLKIDKLVPIDLPEICAPRMKLLSRLDKASGKRCIFIHAPAGCGKTVSALLWIRKSGCKSIWLDLDEYDNSPAAFYRFFCTALLSIIPHEESLSDIIRSPAFGGSPVEYTIEVLSRLSFDDQSSYALVLDDFHLVNHEEILKSFIYILKRLPLSVTVLFLSRNELPALMSPLEESGKVAYLGASELAFDSDEILRFFSNCGHNLTSEEAERVFSLTEGWAIAVGALAISGGMGAGGEIKKGLLDQFIKTHIWNKFDEQLRRFMLMTAIVDEFSEGLAARLSQNPETGRILETLCGGNLFISRQNGEYRYHKLFLDFLRGLSILETNMPKEALYQQAAVYYFENGDYFQSLRYYVKSGDGKGMAAALNGFFRHCGESSSEMSKLYFINLLPPEILEHNPFLYISCTYCSFLLGDAKGMFYFLDRLYERIHEILAVNIEFLEVILVLFSLDARYSFAEQTAKARIEAGAQTVNNLPKSSKSLNHNLPYFHRTFRDFSHYAINTEEHFAEFRFFFSVLLGSDYEIIESGVRSGLLYEQNLLKEAASLIDPNPATESFDLVFLSKKQLAACCYAMGRDDEAIRYRNEIKYLIEKEKILHLLPVYSAYEARVRLSDGDRAAAAAWLDNYFVYGEQRPELNRMFLHFTTVRACIVMGEFEKAQKLCERLKTLAGDFHRFLDAIEATVLLIILKWATGKKQESAALLQSTLAKTRPYHFIRVFAVEGKAVLPIFRRILKRCSCQNGSDEEYRYAQEVYVAAYDQSRRHRGIMHSASIKPVKLSKRQRYVLEFLAKGYRNSEIVKLTGLSINTIRAHTKVVYQKLEVGNRMDAVLRARELGLID